MTPGGVETSLPPCSKSKRKFTCCTSQPRGVSMPPLGPRRLAATNTAPMAHVRGGRKRARRSYLTKKTFEGITTLQMRWEIVFL